MHALPEETIHLLQYLNENDVRPLLYGSQGVSLYLGAFKQFSDIDLLVADEYLHDKWTVLISVMKARGFTLVDEHEHSFRSTLGLEANFAAESILVRDGIIDSPAGIVTVQTPQGRIRTLTAESFRRAYSFSVKDGYRRDTRGKKDEAIIKLLDEHIAAI
jgi:hypothetical protein